MRCTSLFLVCSALGAMLCANVNAETPAFSHQPDPGARFSDALSAADAEREAFLNVMPDSQPMKTGAGKADASSKAMVTIFGSIVNNQGAALCGLVLANGQFMFSCAPNGTYSLTVPQDGFGEVTLFGFVDGHFPYKRVFGGSGGRYDMTLNVASSVSPPVSNSTVRFTITDGCDNGIQIRYKFYDVTNNLVWPSSSTHYATLFYNASYAHDLTCRTGANICYGARNESYYWGVDVDGSKYCSNCCITCQNGNSLSRRLTC
jgi:hypothetical protein